jgi:hypothetical protein
MGLDKVTAHRLADEHCSRWCASTTYAELIHHYEHWSSDDSEVTDAGVAYRISRTVCVVHPRRDMQRWINR